MPRERQKSLPPAVPRPRTATRRRAVDKAPPGYASFLRDIKAMIQAAHPGLRARGGSRVREAEAPEAEPPGRIVPADYASLLAESE